LAQIDATPSEAPNIFCGRPSHIGTPRTWSPRSATVGFPLNDGFRHSFAVPRRAMH